MSSHVHVPPTTLVGPAVESADCVVLIADDHPLFRDALRLRLAQMLPRALLEEASSLPELQQKVLDEGDFDLLLLDLDMPGSYGMTGLVHIRSIAPDLRQRTIEPQSVGGASANAQSAIIAGMPKPTEIRLHQRSRKLEVQFDDGSAFELPCEYLRVMSPSAEVQGHGPGQQVLVAGKAGVGIQAIHPVGHYAVLLSFDDGHDTGIYSWDTLYQLGRDYEQRWAGYLQALQAAGLQREPGSAR